MSEETISIEDTDVKESDDTGVATAEDDWPVVADILVVDTIEDSISPDASVDVKDATDVVRFDVAIDVSVSPEENAEVAEIIELVEVWDPPDDVLDTITLLVENV